MIFAILIRSWFRFYVNVCHLRRLSKRKKGLKAEETKTSKGKSNPLHPELVEALKNTLKVRHLTCELVFHRDGRPITPHDIRVDHKAVCKEAGISGFAFHDFRHTAINNWRKDGHDYFKIMAVSGHKTISVFKRYNMVDEEELKTLIGNKNCDNAEAQISIGAGR